MTEGGKIFIRERLTLNPAAGTIAFVYRAQPVLVGATAEAVYRAEARTRRLSLRDGPVAYGVAQNLVSLSHSDGHVQLTWNKEGTAVAVLKGEEKEDFARKANKLLAFTGIADGSVRSLTYDPAEDPAFPKEMVLSELDIFGPSIFC